MIFREKCDHCERPIDGKYYVDLWERKCCQHCSSDVDNCISCGSSLTSVRYPDGREYCQRCEDKSIRSHSKIKDLLLPKVVNIIQDKGFHIDPHKIKIKLYSDREKVSNKTKVAGLASYKSSSDQVTVKLVVGGNPLVPTLSVLSHEIGHVWAYQNSKGDHLDHPLSEAIADFFSYTVLTNVPKGYIPRTQKCFLDKYKENLMNETDAGRVKEYANFMGHSSLIRLIKRELEGKSWCVIPLLHNQTTRQNKVRVREWKKV